MKRKLCYIVIPLCLSFAFSYIGYILAGATFGRVKNWSSGEVLTHTDLNAEFDNILNNLDPDGVDDASAAAGNMQATTDPYPGGSASLATCLTGELQRLRYVIKQVTGKTYWYQDPLNMTVGMTGVLSRPLFTWADGNTITIGPGAYHHSGTSIQMVYWVSNITFNAGSDGSNAGSTGTQADLSPVAPGWHYIYLDDSAIVTNASPLLVAACFLNSSTAPTWSATKSGWYNGLDRCIFAVYAGDTAFDGWWHDGTFLVYLGDEVQHVTPQVVQDTFVDAEAACWGPAISQKFVTKWYINDSGGEVGGLYWRMNGASNTTGHLIYINVLDDDWYPVPAIIMTDSGQLIELKYVATDANTIDGWTDAWYLPRGM